MNYSYSSRIVTLCAILSVIVFVRTDDVFAATARHTRSRALRGSVNMDKSNSNSNSKVLLLENNSNNRKLKQEDKNDKKSGKKDKDVPSSPKPAPVPAVPVPTTFVPVPTPTFSSFAAPSPTIPIIPAPVPVPAQADIAPTPDDGAFITTDGRIIDEGATSTTSTTTASSSCGTEHDELQECIDSSSSSGGFEICKNCIKAASKLPTMSTFALNSCVNDITICTGCPSESENYYDCFKNPTSQEQSSSSSSSSTATVVIVTVPEAAPVVPTTMVVPASVPTPVLDRVSAPTAPAPAPVPIDESAATATIDRTPDVVVGRNEDSSTIVVTWSDRFDSVCRTQQIMLDDCTGGNSCKTCIKAATQLVSTSSFALDSCIDEVEYCYGCSTQAVAYYECGKVVV